MTIPPIKICPRCGTEYTLEAALCADCGARLVLGPGGGASADRGRGTTGAGQSSTAGPDAVLVREAPAGYLRELGELMRQNGIHADIRYHGCEPGT